MRNSQRYMRRCLRGRRFFFFRDTAIPAACLCPPLGARSTRRVRIRSVVLLLELALAMRERMMAHRGRRSSVYFQS
jgi:hypothetical protein